MAIGALDKVQAVHTSPANGRLLPWRCAANSQSSTPIHRSDDLRRRQAECTGQPHNDAKGRRLHTAFQLADVRTVYLRAVGQFFLGKAALVPATTYLSSEPTLHCSHGNNARQAGTIVPETIVSVPVCAGSAIQDAPDRRCRLGAPRRDGSCVRCAPVASQRDKGWRMPCHERPAGVCSWLALPTGRRQGTRPLGSTARIISDAGRLSA